ncbi:lipoprotein [Helicobacter pylori]
MKSKITHFIAISFVLSLFSACKDDPKKLSQSHQNNTKTTQNNPINQANKDIKKIEHEEEDEKATKEVNDLINNENKIDEINNEENTDPSQKRTNNVLQRATNHQDNLNSPLNRKY